MIVRPARAADVPAILEMWNAVIRDTLITFNSVEKTAEEIAALIAAKEREGHAFLVVEDTGRVAGFGLYGQFRAGAGYARAAEHTIFLDESLRGKGAGRALMRALEDHAASVGIHSMFAGVSGANPAGRAFHAAVGYVEVATIAEVGWKWDRWLDLHLMQKFLSPPAHGG